jgi:hypothetical protein
MRSLGSRRCRAVLTGAVMALGLVAVIATAEAPATAATSSSSHVSSSTATQETLITSTAGLQGLAVAKAANAGYQGKTLISSPWGLHTAGIIARTCSTSTAHWFTIHINYLGGGSGSWFYQCFGYAGTWYFPSNDILWACSGNNYGHFEWYPGTGGETGTNINKGQPWSKSWPSLPPTSADYITISGWSGSYNCP